MKICKTDMLTLALCLMIGVFAIWKSRTKTELAKNHGQPYLCTRTPIGLSNTLISRVALVQSDSLIYIPALSGFGNGYFRAGWRIHILAATRISCDKTHDIRGSTDGGWVAVPPSPWSRGDLVEIYWTDEKESVSVNE